MGNENGEVRKVPRLRGVFAGSAESCASVTILPSPWDGASVLDGTRRYRRRGFDRPRGDGEVIAGL